MISRQELRQGLARWPKSGPGPLLRALGFETLGLTVPAAARADFGLDPAERIGLEIAARHRGFQVLRVRFGDGRLDPESIRRVAAALYRHNPARRALLLFEAPGDDRRVVVSWGLGPGPFRLLKLWVDPTAPRRSELDILAALAVDGGATASDLALAHARALDREGLTRRFFNEFRRQRAQLALRLDGVPESARRDRLDLALIVLGRLLFLYFIQRKGWLAGDAEYLRHLFEDALRSGLPFYRRRLQPLFFGALNRPPQRRGRAARELGDLPYLNGGLFERDLLERKYRRLNIPDDSFAPIIFDLLDRYQFTLREDDPADQDVAVDPEMLGKVFEGLMAGPVRNATGAFFTPRSLVDRLVIGTLSTHLAHSTRIAAPRIGKLIAGGTSSLDAAQADRLRAALASLRVLDPAVGSGAFLLAALRRLEALHDALDGPPADSFARFERRQKLIQHNLHGVDLNPAAVRLCELRLWLALMVDLETDDVAAVPPLPNLDLNVRQGDALVDPIDFVLQLGNLDHGALAGRWRRAVKRLARRRQRYFRSAGPGKHSIQRSLHRTEAELALTFLGELAAQIDSRRRDLRAAARSADLFGRRSGLSRAQKRKAAGLRRRKREVSRLTRRIRDAEELPFFSFPIHFADPERPTANFQVILGNPPWVRTHHWSGLSRHRLRQRFAALRNAGWRAGGRLAGAGRGFGAQLDLSALFLERSLDLLAEDGALGFLLPAKLARSLSAGALRERLLTTTQVISIEDCALTTQKLFQATTYPLGLIVAGSRADRRRSTRIAVHDRHGARLDVRLAQRRLPLLSDDLQSPWALAPPAVRDACDRMRAAGPPLGAQPGRRPGRGIFTGCNQVFLGDLVTERVAADRAMLRLDELEVELEVARLRPALRGEDLSSWRFTLLKTLVWTHEDDGVVLPTLPTALANYLRPHEHELAARLDLRPGQPYWTLFRTNPNKWGHRVAWRDIAPTMQAAVVPGRVDFLRRPAPVISLNTVYQITAASDEDAHLLAAVLNSTAARAYLKAIAERAAGGYFRFLGWTVALLPFPTHPDAAVLTDCLRLSDAAHAAGGMTAEEKATLDERVAWLYGLSVNDLNALQEFDARLSNPVAGA